MQSIVATPPPDLAEWIEQRRALGHDRYDEVWEGECHVAPLAHWRHGYLDEEITRCRGPRVRAAGFVRTGRSNLVDITEALLAAEIDWPAQD